MKFQPFPRSFWMTGALSACVTVAQPAFAQSAQITGVALNPTVNGLEVILQTLDGTSPSFVTTAFDQTRVIEFTEAQLIANEFRQENPTADIASVTVSQVGSDRVRVTIVGESALPSAEIQTTSQGVVVSATTNPLTGIEPVEEVEELEVVVTATRTAEAAVEVPRSVTVIPRDVIERQADVTRDLGVILGKLVPGFAPPSQTSSVFGQTLRGRNVQVLIDGVPQSTNRNAQRDLRTIDPSAVERVEIVRGPSAIYGDGATGGVINIITRRASAQPLVSRTSVGIENSLTNLEDSFGYSLQHYISGTEDNLDFVISAAFTSTPSFFDAEGDRIPPDPIGQGGLADTDTFNFLGKIGSNLGDQQRLQFSFNYFDDQQDSEFARVLNAIDNKARARRGLELEEQPETRNTVLNLDYTHENLFGSRVHGQVYYRNYLTRFSPFDLRSSAAFGNTVLQSVVDSEKYGTRLDIDTPIGDNFSVLWGADYFNEQSSQPADLFDPALFGSSNQLVFNKIGEGILSPPLEQNSLGLFAQLTWNPSDKWVVNGGIRQEFIGVDINDFTTLGGSNVRGGELDYDATLFNIGTVYEVTENVNVFANFAQGFSIADIARQLRTASPGSTVESLRPEAQKVNNYELGVRGDWGRTQASVSGFYNTSDLGTTFDQNFEVIVDPQRIYGVEATVDSQVGQKWFLGGTFTWTEGDTGEDYERPLPNFVIPPLKVTGYVEYQATPSWSNRFQLLYSASRDPEGTGFGLGEVDSYLTADFISSFNVGKGELQVSVENLFNTLYFPNIGQVYGGTFEYAARGTVLGVSYTLNW